MPVIKSAKKKLRQDVKREKVNDLLRKTLKDAIKGAQKSKTAEKIKKAVVLTDKAVKKNLIHKNKAARIKSSLSKLAKPTAKTKTEIKSTTKTVAKASPRAKTAKAKK
jgi:small subunit ribosomal protein S20